jgi:hypothetical protein
MMKNLLLGKFIDNLFIYIFYNIDNFYIDSFIMAFFDKYGFMLFSNIFIIKYLSSFVHSSTFLLHISYKFMLVVY